MAGVHSTRPHTTHSTVHTTGITQHTTRANSMSEQRAYRESQALLRRERSASCSSSEDGYAFASEVELDELEEASFRTHQNSRSPRWCSRPRVNSKITKTPGWAQQYTRSRRKWSRCHRLWRLTLHLLLFLLGLLVATAVIFPSYTHPPERYTELRTRVLASTELGAANPHN